VKVKKERVQVTKEVKGLRANKPGGDITTPFVIPAQHCTVTTEERVLQVYDDNIHDYVDVSTTTIEMNNDTPHKG
jgi:hypothetical protein